MAPIYRAEVGYSVLRSLIPYCDLENKNAYFSLVVNCEKKEKGQLYRTKMPYIKRDQQKSELTNKVKDESEYSDTEYTPTVYYPKVCII